MVKKSDNLSASAKDLSANLKVVFTAEHAKLLKSHLQALIRVEFTTIPLYLAGVYSFTNEAIGYSPGGSGSSFPFSDIQQEALSVAVQEMYHLQGACNLANVFKVTPQIPQMSLVAGQEIEVENLVHGEEPDKGKPLKIKLGNMPDVLQYMLAIEQPDPNPKPDFKPNAEVKYDSIGDLYHATLILIGRYLKAYAGESLEADPHFFPGNNQVAYGAFPTRYWFNKIDMPELENQYQDPRTIMAQLINAITEQGEGTNVAERAGGPFKSVTKDGVVPPPYNQMGTGGRFHDFDNLTHYKRFEDVQSKLNELSSQISGDPFYTAGTPWPDKLPSWVPEYKVLQNSLNVLWSYLIDLMQAGFTRGNLEPDYIGPVSQQPPGFFDVMLSFKYVIPLIWQRGFCPSFEYQKGVKRERVQKALDDVDPYCLYHWDAATAAVRAKAAIGEDGFRKNACQGLNACQGQGWGGVATGAGTGQCATADFHTCQGSNKCNYQGGCGFLSPNLPSQQQWVPGQNTGAQTGGCQTPISAKQVFDRNANIPSDWPTTPWNLNTLKGTSVWNHAREILAQGLSPQEPPKLDPKTEKYDGDTRRKLVSATST
jgi:Ferritin-like